MSEVKYGRESVVTETQEIFFWNEQQLILVLDIKHWCWTQEVHQGSNEKIHLSSLNLYNINRRIEKIIHLRYLLYELHLDT